MNYLHIGQMDPETHEGGVAQLARHLRVALGDDLEYTHFENVAVPYWKWIEQKQVWGPDTSLGPIDGVKYTVKDLDAVIADGYYGLGLADIAKKLIVVCHGTYAGWVRDCSINPYPGWDEHLPWFLEAARHQEQAYREADVLVSVSTSAQEELWDIYRLDSELILLGVDTGAFKPDVLIPESVVEVAGGDMTKGADIISELRDSEKGNLTIENLGFEGNKPDRWLGYQVALLPSRHEAGSYALLEALAMNKHVVGYKTGLLRHDVPDDIVRSTYDYYPGTFERMVREAFEDERPDTHSWVLENASLDLFCEKWQALLS